MARQAPDTDANQAPPGQSPGSDREAPGPSQRSKDRDELLTVAGSLIIASAGWYLLQEFAPLLRPLLLAVLPCYVILPSQCIRRT